MTQYEGHLDQRWGHITYSHCADDIVIMNLIEHMRIMELMHTQKFHWLDLGAHHPFTISNTALLYSRGYRGVNIEANPMLIDAFKELRPGDTTVNVGVGVNEGILPFYMFDDGSGINSFSKEHFERLGPNYAYRKQIDVPVMTVNHIVEKHCEGKWPALLSVDLEGLDIPVLMSANFTQWNKPKIIIFEDCGNTQEALLELDHHLRVNHGYHRYIRLAANVIYTAHPPTFF